MMRTSFSRAQPQDTKSKACRVCHETYQPQGKSADEFVTKPPAKLAEDAFWLKKGHIQNNAKHTRSLFQLS